MATGYCTSQAGSRSTAAKRSCTFRATGLGPASSPTRSNASKRSRHPPDRLRAEAPNPADPGAQRPRSPCPRTRREQPAAGSYTNAAQPTPTPRRSSPATHTTASAPSETHTLTARSGLTPPKWAKIGRIPGSLPQARFVVLGNRSLVGLHNDRRARLCACVRQSDRAARRSPRRTRAKLTCPVFRPSRRRDTSDGTAAPCGRRDARSSSRSLA